jgi:hypothetical protein
VNVIITGTPTSLGEGFYDPGAGFANRITASINGGVTVNSVTYNSTTQVTLNISTVGATVGSKTVTITNPDGQSTSSSTIFDVPLPVELSSFNYSIDKREVTLNWVTTMELNNKGFDVERKSETGQWKKIGFINGNGTSNQPHQYFYKDIKLETGKYNYRIKQIDYNGTFEHFYLNDIVSVGVPGVSEVSQNYPNPFNPVTKIDYHLASEGNVSIKIYDLAGREVKSLIDEFKKAGFYTIEFDASSLASGVYFYKMASSDFVQIKKMIVVK